MKKRSDSLHAKLSPKNRDELLSRLIDQGSSLENALTLCSRWGVQTSLASLSRFVSSQGLIWRLEKAKLAAEESEKTLPTNHDELRRRGLAQREFELAFTELSAKELYCLKRLDLAQGQLELDRKKLDLMERKLNSAKKVLEEKKLTPQEREARMKEIFGMGTEEKK
jgi:hypothetical protein